MIDRIRERKLVQWALAYLAGGWLLLEVAQMVGDAFDWPSWVQRALIVAVAVGLAATLVLAWYHGEKGRQRVSGPELLMLAALFLVAGGAVMAIASGEGATLDGTSAEEGGDGVVAGVSTGGEPGAAGALDRLLTGAQPSLERSIAVLPFDNLSADPDNAYFALAVSDEITHALQQVGGLRVINRASVSRYADSDLSFREIGERLEVGRILSGSVQRQGDEVRILAQLMDAGSESQLWSDRYVQRLDDEFRVQAEIAERIAQALEGEFDPSAASRITAGGTESTAALELYLRAREVWFRDPWGPGALHRARGLMWAALEIDSAFARARADLSGIYVDLAEFDGPEMADSALTIARLASAQAPDMGDGYGALCYAQATLGHVEAALANCGRAVELAPGSSDAFWNLGNVLANVGRAGDGLVAYERALRSAPDLPGLNGSVGMVWDMMGDSARAQAWYEERRRLAPEVESEIVFFRLFSRRGHVSAAEAALERMAAIEPDHWLVHQSRAVLQLLDGEPEDAVASLLRYEETEDPEWDPPTLLAFAYQMAGERRLADSTAAFAEALADRYRARGDQGSWIPETLASLAALEGRLDEAVDHLEEAVTRGLRGAHQIRYQFTRRPLWGHERFEVLVERVGQLDAAEHERALALTTFPDGYPVARP